MRGEIETKILKKNLTKKLVIKRVRVKFKIILKWEDNFELLIVQHKFWEEEREKKWIKKRSPTAYSHVSGDMCHLTQKSLLQCFQRHFRMQRFTTKGSPTCCQSVVTFFTCWIVYYTPQLFFTCPLTLFPFIFFSVKFSLSSPDWFNK